MTGVGRRVRSTRLASALSMRRSEGQGDGGEAPRVHKRQIKAVAQMLSALRQCDDRLSLIVIRFPTGCVWFCCRVSCCCFDGTSLCSYTRSHASIAASSASSQRPGIFTSDLPLPFHALSIQPNVDCAQTVLYSSLLTHFPIIPLIYRYRTRRQRSVLTTKLSTYQPPFHPTFCRIRPFFIVFRLPHVCTGPAPYLVHLAGFFFHFYLQLFNTFFCS